MHLNNHKFKINYRPEIDGLRAVSVFAVILYHADFFFFNRIFFQGGYIGLIFSLLFQVI
jgi:peptidoglycan/LPS O-acetylase OafA/YrhL